MESREHLTGLTVDELRAFVRGLGEPDYRARQLFVALQRRRLRSFDEMTDSAERVSRAAARARHRFDAHRRIALHLGGRHAPLPVEDARQSAGRDRLHPRRAARHHLFLVAVGLPAAMQFLSDGEARAAAHADRRRDRRADRHRLNDAYGAGVQTPRGTNLVAMGAGEPFLAFEPLMKALGVMADPKADSTSSRIA